MLDKTTLKSAIQTIFEDTDPASNAAGKAQKLADAIDVFVKSGTVSVTVNGMTGPCAPGAPAAIISQPGTGSVS